MKAFWWIGKPNFGDWLSPLLLERFAHTACYWTPAVDAEVVMVGSILESLSPSFTGAVIGTGKLWEKTKVFLPHANIVALRGPLSAQGVPGDYILGDTALLANRLVQGENVREVEKEHDLGLVPHWSDAELELRPEFKRYDPLIIRPTGDPLGVIRQIGSCKKIVSSSLHGNIVADSFCIPRRTEIAPRLRDFEGGMFKFRDHDLAVGFEEFKVGVMQRAPRWHIADLQHALYDAIEKLGKSYA